MAEADSAANVSETIVEATTIIIETIVEATEYMAMKAEEITKEATVDVVIMIMATIVTEIIIAISVSS